MPTINAKRAAALHTGLLVALLAACATEPAPDATTPVPVEEIERLIGDFVTDGEVVGLQAAIGVGDAVVWTGACSSADLENDLPVTDETRFRTASISKWMTGTAAMHLVEQGRLDLDEDVQTYCPEYPVKRWPLTTRQLLQHRAGVRHYIGSNGEPRETEAQRAALREVMESKALTRTVRYTNTVDALAPFKDDPLLFEPGTDYGYTSFGYRVVGCVLRGAARSSLNDLMDEVVFRPAGMSSTRDDDAFAIVPGRVHGYRRDDDGQLRRSAFRDVSENLPAGGHLSTTSDLVRFALAWHAGTLIDPASIDEMTTAPDGADPGSFYGLGVSVTRVDALDGATAWLHSGSQDETRTWLILLPERDVAIAMMSNDEDVPLMTEVIWPVLAIVTATLPPG